MSSDPFTAFDHGSMVGPEGGYIHNDELELNDDVVRTLYVSSWPNKMNDKTLEKVFTEPSGTVDVSIHQEPITREKSLTNYKRGIRQLKTVLNEQQERDSVEAEATRDKVQKRRRTKRLIEEGEMRMHNVAVYVTIRASSEQRVDSIENTIKTDLTHSQLTLKRVRHKQTEGALATSPLALDKLEYSTMLPSTALSSLYPFTASTVIEPSGVLLGYHSTTDAPVMVDRFDRDSGFNLFITGKTGNGKSFGSKLMLLRRRIKDPDTQIYIIDPLSDFTRFVNKMNGVNVPVGGKLGVNPLDIQQTPQRVMDANPHLDPFGNKMAGIEGMFDEYFEERGFDFNTERSVLDEARGLAYERAGITQDVATHGKPSPTIRPVEGEDRVNLWEILAEIVEDPTETIPGLETNDETNEAEAYSEGAEKLRMALRGFHDGQAFGHLGGVTDFDLDHDSQVVCLDLQQDESSSDLGLMMKQLLDSVYQRTKRSSGKSILVIDECHRLLDNDYALDWLQRVVRYARHHDLSLHLATQNSEDFCQNDQRWGIVKNCSTSLHFKEDAVPDRLFTSADKEFMDHAKPGDQKWGFAHALLKVNGNTYPVKVSGLEEEENLISEEIAEARGVA